MNTKATKSNEKKRDFSDWGKNDTINVNEKIRDFRRDMLNAGKRFFGEKYFD